MKHLINREDYINEYVIGKNLDVIYYDGHVENVEITEDMVDYSSFSFNEIGAQNFTITYGLEGQEKRTIELSVEVVYDGTMTNVIIESYNNVIYLSESEISNMSDYERFELIAKQMNIKSYIESGRKGESDMTLYSLDNYIEKIDCLYGG